jgi:outer membrane protein assembly factor BamB
MIYPDSGAVRLELPITINEAASELERIVDIDGKVVVASDVLVSASYQGHITAIDLQQGRPIWQEKVSTTKDLVEVRSRVVAIDDKDILKAFGLSSGVVLWQQEGLKLRGLTSPVSVRGNIAVGDFEGYIHIINGGDGSFLGRFRASKNPIVEIVSEGDKLAITDDKGRLFFLSLT